MSSKANSHSLSNLNNGGAAATPAAACAGCAVHSRRNFLEDAARGVAAVLGLSLLDAGSALAQITALSAPAAGARGEAKYPIPPSDGVRIDTTNEVILARTGGSVYAFALACPHQNTALRWRDKEHRFQCPKHQSKYTPTGEFISGRATRNMDRLPIKLDGTSVVVDNTQEIRSDTEAAKWAAAVVKIPA